MRKTVLIAAAMAAFVGAGVMARGSRNAPEPSDRTRDSVLPYDAYPDQLSLEIWNAA